MKHSNFFFLALLLAFSLTVSSQNEFSKWYFGQQAGLDFATSPPTVLSNGSLVTVEGVATVCDNTGNLLFYSEGTAIRNSLHGVMDNSGGLTGNQSSTQAVLIVKQPGSDSLYYVFTTTYAGNSNGARYSIVDMSLAAGLGSVTVKNATLHAPSCEKQVAVRHCNGKDVWIISHPYNTNQFTAYLLTKNGLNTTPVISAIGETPTGSGISSIGHLKVSPDGKKLAMATYTNSVPMSMGSGGFHLFDFDAASGVVSNSLALLSSTNIPNNCPYGVEFSPDGTKLYGTTSPATSIFNCVIYQWNICAGNNSAIIASQYSVSTGTLALGSIQWAIDGKLYIAASNIQSLSVIHNPNASGAAMGFTLNGLSIAPKTSNIGLPNYINGYTHTVPALFSHSLSCQSGSFSVPTAPSFSSGCSAVPYTYNNYLWDFGEPGSGAANSSTLTNPAHSYSSTGTYTVSLILYGACTSDTLKKIIILNTAGPNLAVAGNFTVCKGDKYTYIASGANTYTWSNNAQTTAIALAPATSSVYSVSGSLNGCKESKSFTITVEPCTGLNKIDATSHFSIFPNPFKDLLSIETSADAELTISEMNGKVVFKTELKEGHQEINTSELKAGMYLVQARNGESVWRGRFVKVE